MQTNANDALKEGSGVPPKVPFPSAFYHELAQQQDLEDANNLPLDFLSSKMVSKYIYNYCDLPSMWHSDIAALNGESFP